jgi:hypothetical protein
MMDDGIEEEPLPSPQTSCSPHSCHPATAGSLSDSLMLTEPILDASYLDDEINTVNDEFSSWKLLTTHTNVHG